MKNLPIGSMIGQMNAADFSTRLKHLATIKAGSDGMIAVLPFGELKSEVRKSPQEVRLIKLFFFHNDSHCSGVSVRFSK